MLRLDSSIVWHRAGLESAWILLTDQPAVLPAAPICSCFSTFASLPPCRPHTAHSSLNRSPLAGPLGFNAVKDTQDGYQFVYPFGWQEVQVEGQDVVYKDIIEPLESVSVTVEKTDKQKVSEFGSPEEVRGQLQLCYDYKQQVNSAADCLESVSIIVLCWQP